MLKGLLGIILGKKQVTTLEDKPFEQIRTSKKEGILNTEEIEDRIGGGTVTGYYHLVRTERVEGELLGLSKKSYDEKGVQVSNIKLRIKDDEGIEGEVYFPEELPRGINSREVLNQRVKYEHKSDRKCERCLGGDNQFNKYSLTILTGSLEGRKYIRFKHESL